MSISHWEILMAGGVEDLDLEEEAIVFGVLRQDISID